MTKNLNFRFIVFILFVFTSFFSISQSLNRLNKKGERIGKWITYIDDDKKIKSFEGKFRNGASVGKSFYYDNKGVLERTDVKRFKKLKTTFYHPNGKVRLKGNAHLEFLPDKIHYYFYGKWKSYSEDGVLIKYLFYENGKFIKAVYLDKDTKLNDSLVFVLNQIDNEFVQSNKNLVDSINTYKDDLVKQNNFKQLLHLSDSLCYLKIDTVLSKFGYPSRQIVGEDVVGIPFYILSFAPLYLKEKHYNTIIRAVSKGDVEPSSFAYFADKIKVARGQKQIYGTQYYVKNEQTFYYPIEDKEHLNERRKSVGLDPFKE